MPDFDVGDGQLQERLEWVDQPEPPEKAGDTHALAFLLLGPEAEGIRRLVYTGLMFYRPGNPAATLMQRLPGLDGVAKKRFDNVNCHNAFELTPEHTDTADLGFSYDYIKVEVRFRTRAQEPPQAFMGFQFRKGTGAESIGLLLGSETRSTDHRPTEIDSVSVFPHVRLMMSNELGDWMVHALHKTTVLSSGA